MQLSTLYHLDEDGKTPITFVSSETCHAITMGDLITTNAGPYSFTSVLMQGLSEPFVFLNQIIESIELSLKTPSFLNEIAKAETRPFHIAGFSRVDTALKNEVLPAIPLSRLTQFLLALRDEGGLVDVQERHLSFMAKVATLCISANIEFLAGQNRLRIIPLEPTKERFAA